MWGRGCPRPPCWRGVRTTRRSRTVRRYGVTAAPEQSVLLCHALAPGPSTLHLAPLTSAPRQYLSTARPDGATTLPDRPESMSFRAARSIPTYVEGLWSA